MRFLQRLNDQQQRQPGNGDDGGSADRLQQVRADSDALLAAGDEVIQRAISGSNSEAFLRANRQQSGQ
jgi:hypothetical protein